MIRMSKSTDYAVVLMTYIASEKAERTFTARDLTSTSHLPAPMVSKILKALTRGGVLNSHRGVKGGYSLARSPEDISIAEILEALEGPLAIMQCIGEVPSCGIESLCPSRTSWQRINAAVQATLDGISLEEMARPLRTSIFRVRDGSGVGAGAGA